jgi:hypothetical protein
LAALRIVCLEEKERFGLDERSVVVLFCTEGTRKYKTPA